ncbi:hypothetical protein V6N11_005083 [Hibiscus sabdariffa]|uniref:RING-type E3 ubiquitin transferase n=1 Tax=Hibiscus sabdariffa TaxID=183260 RepID=A0ABR2RLP1_9ROSI
MAMALAGLGIDMWPLANCTPTIYKQPTNSPQITPNVVLAIIVHTVMMQAVMASAAAIPYATIVETLCFGLDVLQSRNRIHQVLDPAFTRLGINTSSTSYNTMVREIIGGGLIIADMMVHRGYYCEVMYLQSVIQAVLVENEINQVSRALAEFDNINYGMVASNESSVKKMLKRIRVENGDQENCMICLEQLKVEFEASRMPCGHNFHGDCIERWLKQSHYCPVCRFEMPTN